MPQSRKTASRHEGGEKLSLWRQTKIPTVPTTRQVARRTAGWNLPYVPVRSGRTKRNENDWFAPGLYRNRVSRVRAVPRDSASGAGLSTGPGHALDVSPA